MVTGDGRWANSMLSALNELPRPSTPRHTVDDVDVPVGDEEELISSGLATNDGSYDESAGVDEVDADFAVDEFMRDAVEAERESLLLAAED